MQAEIGSPIIPIDPQLYKAAREGDIGLLEQRLQQRDVQVHAVDGALQPIPLAIEGGRETEIDRQFNCLLGVTYSGDTALHLAAYFGHLHVARRICNANIYLLLRGNKKSETPLHYAAQAGKHEVVTHFIQAAGAAQQLRNDLQPEGTDVAGELLRRRNRDGETALYQAVHNKHPAVVEILITACPDLASIPDSNNVSPLYVAAMRAPPEVVALLIETLCDTVSVEAYAGPRGQTALHAAAAFRKGDTIQKILDWNRDLAKAKDDTGSTPLHFAASADNIDAVQLLLENDTTPAYIPDADGLFPVHVVAKLGNWEVVNQLFELCPDTDELRDARGRNFLHIAVEKREESVVRWARKSNRLDRVINEKDDEGNTAMHLAVQARHLAIFALLLESKTIDLDIINKEGLTPVDLAKAQMTSSIYFEESRNTIILHTLLGIRSPGGIHRIDHFFDEYKLDEGQTMQREAETLENTAKNMSTVSVLIASASFAGMFTVSGGNQSSGLHLAFNAFIVTIAYAFVCSITATGLFMSATLTCIDQMDRHKSLFGSIRLAQMAIRGLVVAFALGGYVVLTPVSKWLAILICLTGAVVPSLINPLPRANIIIPWSLVRSIGWKELWRRGQDRSRCSVLYPLIYYYISTLFLGFVTVLTVLLCSLFDISQNSGIAVISVRIIVPLSLSILAYLELLCFHTSN